MTKTTIPSKYRGYTRTALLAAAAGGTIGSLSTAADIASIAGIWGTCLFCISRDEGYVFDKDTAIKVCKSALLGLGGYYIGCKTVTKIFLLIPGAGVIAAMGVSAMTNILFTYRFVLTLCSVFRKYGDNFSPETLVINLIGMFHGNGMMSDALDIIGILKTA